MIVLLGPPGSGKGTQGDIISEKYGIPKISTGDMLRSAVEKGTSLGNEAKEKMDRGELVDDEIVLAMLKERISETDCENGYVLDGFPRNIVQAEKLAALVGDIPMTIIDILLADDVVIQRLTSRRICNACDKIYNLAERKPKQNGRCDNCQGELIQRKDDNPEIIRERLRIYHEEIEPLIVFYKNQSVYHHVNGEKDIQKVFANVKNILNRNIDGKEH